MNETSTKCLILSTEYMKHFGYVWPNVSSRSDLILTPHSVPVGKKSKFKLYSMFTMASEAFWPQDKMN